MFESTNMARRLEKALGSFKHKIFYQISKRNLNRYTHTKKNDLPHSINKPCNDKLINDKLTCHNEGHDLLRLTVSPPFVRRQ